MDLYWPHNTCNKGKETDILSNLLDFYDFSERVAIFGHSYLHKLIYLTPHFISWFIVVKIKNINIWYIKTCILEVCIILKATSYITIKYKQTIFNQLNIMVPYVDNDINICQVALMSCNVAALPFQAL